MSASTRPASSTSTAPSLIPLGDHVSVRLLPPPPVDSPIFYTPNSLTERAEILAVGSTVKDLRPGQTVLCRPLHGMAVGDLLLLPQSAILATET